MILYKYLPYNRKSTLENGSIRFTQPSCFNDPFEARPNVEQIFPTEFINELFRNLLNTDLYVDFINKLSDKDTIKAIKEYRTIMINNNPDELKTSYNRLTIGDSHENPTEIMKVFWDKQVGILSLSEENDNLTMWSHYTQNHRGFIIGFNHEKEITDREKCMIQLKKITYSCVRPTLTLFELDRDKDARNKQWIKDFLYTKSKDWSYENEWRQVNYLKKADNLKKVEDNDIYLFKYNRDAVKEIYLGCNMTPDNKKEITELVKDWDITLFEMKLNSKHYNLDKIRIK